MRGIPPALLAGALMLASPAAAFADGAIPTGGSPFVPAEGGASTTIRSGGGTRYDPLRVPGERVPAPRAQESGATAAGLAARARLERAKAARRRVGSRPTLTAFAVRPARFYLAGSPALVSFTIKDRSPTVRVRLDVLAADGRTAIRKIDLGERRTRTAQTFLLSGSEGGPLPEGRLQLRLAARDPQGHRLARPAQASRVNGLEFYWHAFPVAGPFNFGGEGGRFGAARTSYSHEGQDLIAAEGTPVVAPRGGTVTQVAFQESGAGNYLILRGDGEARDYAFMHLQGGSLLVQQGQHVITGQQIAKVGSTGRSSTPHLHFEIWEGGGWKAGGKPVDPLPHLRSWNRPAPTAAVIAAVLPLPNPPAPAERKRRSARVAGRRAPARRRTAVVAAREPLTLARTSRGGVVAF